MVDSPTVTRQLRSKLKAQRRQLSPIEKQRAARGLARNLLRMRVFRASRTVAFYLAVGGEIDPAPALHSALRAGKYCYLPVLSPGRQNRLLFARVTATSRFRNNRYAIPEPQQPRHRHRSASQLDLILAPLVAFDKDGNRIGMGGGYYDATLAFRCRSHWRRPCLIGLAYSFQQVETIKPQPWDVALDGVVTEVRPNYRRG